MGVYIEGVKMPKNGETITITICDDGIVFEERKEPGSVFKAIPVPEHRRLIDADALTHLMGMDENFSPLEAMYLMELIADAPTIIPESR